MALTLKQYRERHPQALSQLLALIKHTSTREPLAQAIESCNCTGLACYCLPVYSAPKGVDYSGFISPAN